MAARRCALCGINYPVFIGNMCPTCEQPMTWYENLQPVDDWKERVASAIEEQVLAAMDAELIPTVQTTLRVSGDNFAVSTHDVVRSGILSRLNDGSLLRVEDEDGSSTIVEILAYSYTGRVYIARLFSMEFPDYVPRDWLPKKKRRKKSDASK
jgi:hypothetical protein